MSGPLAPPDEIDLPFCSGCHLILDHDDRRCPTHGRLDAEQVVWVRYVRDCSPRAENPLVEHFLRRRDANIHVLRRLGHPSPDDDDGRD
jgi:hypothetical protein